VQLHIGESRDSGSALRASRNAGGKLSVIASIAKQSIGPHAVLWVASCYASRNDGKEFPRVTEKDLHFYEPKNGHGLKHDPFNAIVAPRPIGWISSRDAKGNINLAPYSFFNGFCYHPPIIGFSSTSWKDSVQNIQETGEFVWNLATMDLAKQMNETAAHVAHDVSEFKIAGLTAAPGKLVNVPRVVSFECKLTQIIQLQGANGEKANAWVTFGEVVAVHIDKAMIKDGVYQTAAARPIVRAGRRGDYFEIRPEAMFEMIRPD
jgi:flavin reductase (DIM6/NTAB) family NADH-FMN oxidoreductase RutF